MTDRTQFRPVDLAHWFGTRVNFTINRLRQLRSNATLRKPSPLNGVIDTTNPHELVALVADRDNPARSRAVAEYLTRHHFEYETHSFDTFEGDGTTYIVDVPAQNPPEGTVVVAAHHDAVPGSGGANDNASSVAVLLTLLHHLRAAPPERVTVRALFTALEERAYLGSRQYVRSLTSADLEDVQEMLSLELCGYGDTVVLWDVDDDDQTVAKRLVTSWTNAEIPHTTAGRMAANASDHRPWRTAGVPAYVLSILPNTLNLAQRARTGVFSREHPPPFDTYHTAGDSIDLIDPHALALAITATQTALHELDTQPQQ